MATLVRTRNSKLLRPLVDQYAIEAIEPRLFHSVTYYSDASSLSSSASFFSSVLYGDNGQTWGMPTAMTGYSSTVAAVGYTVWDSDPDDGVDSKLHTLTFGLNTTSAHIANMQVDNVSVGGFSVSSSTAVHSVTLKASVDGPGLQFAFSNVSVSFYSGTTLVESVSVNNFSADTQNSSSWDGASAAAVVTPNGSNITGVYVSASFQMKANEGTYPDTTSLFGQVLIS